jgi:hypothetical protein
MKSATRSRQPDGVTVGEHAAGQDCNQCAPGEAAGLHLDDFSDVLLLADIAAVLRTSERTVKRRLRAGTFPIPMLPGIDKRIRFAKADIERFLLRGDAGRGRG